MPRVTTVLFASGALLLGTALLARPGAAEPSAPPAVVAEGGFRTADGAAAAFRHIRAAGRYTITEDAVSVTFTTVDSRRDGWTAGVQFATTEAWDEHHSAVFHPAADPAEPRPGAARGPRLAAATPPDRPACHGCVVVEPRRPPKGKSARPADGKIAYRFPQPFVSAYTEGLWVREVLVKREGRRTVLRPGPAVELYRAPAGKVHPGADDLRVAPLAAGSPYTADFASARPAAPERRAVPPGTTQFAGKQEPDEAPARLGAEAWGSFGRTGQAEDLRARLVLRIRDLASDRRLPGVIVTFTDEAGTRVDTWTFWNGRDRAGRWTSRTAVNGLSGHLYYRACVGTQKYTEGEWAYEPTACGDTRQGY